MFKRIDHTELVTNEPERTERFPITRPRYARAEIRDPNGYHIELRQWF